MQNLTLKAAEWETFKAKERFRHYGTDHIKLASPGAVYGHPGDVLIGHGTEFKIRSDFHEISCSVPYVLYMPSADNCLSPGQILTNESKRPNISAAEAAVTLALRRFNRRQRLAAEESARLTIIERARREAENTDLPEPEVVADGDGGGGDPDLDAPPNGAA